MGEDLHTDIFKEEKEDHLSMPLKKAKNDPHRRWLTKDERCGLVTPPKPIYDSIIDVHSPLLPLFEEYKYSGFRPQWTPPSIMCCLRTPTGEDSKPLSVTQFTAYRHVSECCPFSEQKKTIPDGE